MEYSFHVYNKLAADGAAMAADKLLRADLERKLTPRSLARKTGEKEDAGTGSRSKNAAFQRHFDGNLDKPPVVVCIGSDLAIGDSLGPITGSMLKYKTQGIATFVYGTLAAPVTAKEIKYLRTFLRETHAGSQIVAVDAAVGAEGDIGLIKLTDSPLYPGAGANKKLGAIGDISVMGIVAERSLANYGLLNTTRLNLVYTMSELISDALASLLWNRRDLSATARKNG
ncbi:MAG: spore protease YyaC [Clostridia bacterium]|nr:spore protease YyaC [Clostridia bacterium]